jgi:hypothetical protein
MRYFFHLKDGIEVHDEKGMEFDDIDAVKHEAFQSSVDMLRGRRGDHFWTGEPWLLWVTDQPNGQGNTILSLTFAARLT